MSSIGDEKLRLYLGPYLTGVSSSSFSELQTSDLPS